VGFQLLFFSKVMQASDPLPFCPMAQDPKHSHMRQHWDLQALQMAHGMSYDTALKTFTLEMCVLR